MDTVTGKVAIVTGASAGIGRATAKLFAAEGAKVVAAARRQGELDKLVAEIENAGGEAVAVAGDVKDEALAKALVDTAVNRFGGLDIAFNNAGILGAMGPVSEMTLSDWRDTLETNLTSAFLGAKYQIPAMLKRGGGSLLFTSSFVGYSNAGLPGMAAYAASKAGLIGLVKSLAGEYGPRGIRANAILPGGTDTAMAPADDPEARAFIEGLHALKRMAEPEEIARPVLHLASDAASFITGSALLVDGGVSINLG
ncbi:SDR family oxidoreductase [Pelagibius litoralis]|uniref:SDR family oxidoreductase n=1 Tax=Pelagibius litoralis TaxID=374515 RepID=A0A967C2L1_9PROT|nr:SDR family oxidoreductase [Pelagibius litoralis]NIA68453.1 SDR family oxidoreductase [Pelagibius litoralis]